MRRWEGIALSALAVLIVVAAVVDVAHRLDNVRRIAADKVSFVTWHHARSQPAGSGIKIRYGHPYDVVCGSVGKNGLRLNCLELRSGLKHPTVAGGYRLVRPARGTPFVRTHCFGAAVQLNGCHPAVKRRT